jgi:hypothetical protein
VGDDVILHLGVVDQLYTGKQPASTAEVFAALQAGKGVPKKSVVHGAVSTGDVAEFLENKYHVMETFFEAHADEIAEAVIGSYAGAAESILQGAPSTLDPFVGAAGDIKAMFNRFLDSGEMERMGIPGVPTKAAQEGVSQRFKTRHGPPRPSFIDTGLYESSFVAWVD